MSTSASLEDVDEVTKQAKVSIPVEAVNKEFELAIDQLSRTVKVKGFRPGKVPKHVVEKLHGKRVRMEVANRLISSSLQDVLKEHELNVVGQPEIEVSSFEPDEEIQYTANISIFPTPTIEKYDAFEVSVPKREVKDDDVDAVIERIRQSRTTTRKLEFRNTVQAGDVIDASLLVEYEGAEPSRPEPLVVGLGEGKLPEELETGLVGLEVGASRDITVDHPDDYPNEELRGKKVTYKVTLNGLSEKVLPEVDDEFVKGLEDKVETVVELRLHIREQLEKQAKNNSREELQQAILEQLIERNEFLVPQPLVDHEIRSILVRSGYVDPRKVNPDFIPVEELRKDFGEMALKRVKTMVIVDMIGEQDKIEVSDADLDAYVEEVAAENQLPVADVRGYFLGDERKAGTKQEVFRNKVLDLLVDRAKVTYTDPKEEEKAEEK